MEIPLLAPGSSVKPMKEKQFNGNSALPAE